ncbi:cupin superfamily protein-domain-containing protein [Pelagophyceae sp. CCMP2097]|nr:cupin superfamily protein-domain-containing protein [Pelagophyceae sp. CCMP2097]
MARVGKKGSAVPWPDVRAAIANAATVVLNSADANVPALASLSVAALDAFRLPVCVNVYTTGAGAQTSAPPHTDKQRVLVLQCEGNKRWRVYPPAKLAVGTEPLARGKGEDLLAWAELAEPLIDCVLRPGDVLYIPAGFPHATETVSCYEDTAPAETDLPRASLHLTLGVDTHIWGLDGYGARGGVLRRTNRVDRLRPESDLGDDAYWRLRRTLPLLGWRASADANADTEAMATAITEAARAAETRVDGAFEDADATVVAVAKKLRAHASALVSAQRAHLSAVAQALKPLGASSAPTYFVALERLQISLDEWYGEFETREFSMGDEVQATITGDDSTFFDAYVEKEHADGTLDLVFFDGDAEYGVPKSRVRRKKVKAAKKGTSAAAKGGFGGAPKSAKAAKKKR